MKLLLKFNLIFILVMALGVAVSGFISRNLLQTQAQQEVTAIGRLLIEQATAVRGYTSGQITKLLETQMKYEFLPQSATGLMMWARMKRGRRRPILQRLAR